MNVSAQCTVSPSLIYSFTYGGKSYELVKELKTWEQASQCAVSRGGYLVHIDSQEEQTAVYNAIIASGIASNYNPILDAGGISYVWIGASDKQTEGNWLWDGDNDGVGSNFWNGEGALGNGGGSTMNGKFVNWGGKSKGAFQEPDNFNVQNAGAIALAGWPSGISNRGVAGEWNDLSSNYTLYYVIEYESANTNINKLESEIKIFPNPTYGKVTLQTDFKPSENTFLEILDANGKLIQKIKLDTEHNIHSLDISGNKEGLYIFNLKFDSKEIIRKIYLK